MTIRTAIVTGAARGIGAAISERLAQDGMQVAVLDLNERDCDAVVARITAAGGKAIAVGADVSDPVAVELAVDRVAKELGEPTVLVNNAGIIRREDAIKFDEKDWDDVVDLNLKTVFFFAQAAAKHFIAQGDGGKIINVASMLSFQGGVRVPSYTASKSGVIGITRALANEWAGHRINVNAIAPGYMATNNTAALRADESRNSSILERIPAGRWGVPDDLAGPVVFLASRASDYVNGYTVAVDGGWLAR